MPASTPLRSGPPSISLAFRPRTISSPGSAGTTVPTSARSGNSRSSPASTNRRWKRWPRTISRSRTTTVGAGWVPLLANGGGDFLVEDQALGSPRPIREFLLDESDAPVEYLDLASFVATVADAFRQNAFTTIDGYLKFDRASDAYARIAADRNPGVAWWQPYVMANARSPRPLRVRVIVQPRVHTRRLSTRSDSSAYQSRTTRLDSPGTAVRSRTGRILPSATASRTCSTSASQPAST